MINEHYAGAFDVQQQGWNYGYDNYGQYTDNTMYQHEQAQQQTWMYGQMNQQPWMPQQDTGFYGQQPMAPQPCGGNACLIDLDEYSDMSSSDSETEAPPSKAGGKAAAIANAKVADEFFEPLKRTGSEAEPAAEPSPAAFVEGKIRAPESLKILDSEERTETSSIPDSPGSRFYSSSSEPDAEASIKCSESDFSDSEMLVENQPGELFCGSAADLLRWRSVAMGRNLLGYGVASATTACGQQKSRAPGRATAQFPKAHGSSPHSGGSKSSRSKKSRADKDGSWLSSPVSTPKKSVAEVMSVSKTSWAAQQRERRSAADEGEASMEVIRKIKSILNKLTIEKFPQLSKRLMEEIDFSNTEHVEFLISELFEKATTQHHFIDMYGDLCALLQDFFTSRPVVADEKFSFKRLLLNECQRTFERCLKPPEHKADIDQEERDYRERLYKDKMLGNIRFVGALLARNMLASKVLLAILEELLAEPTPEALESLAVLLVQIGPIFDTPQWTYHAMLNGYFKQVQGIIAKDDCPTRIRCLLKDVLDLRNNSWQDKKPKRLEGPMKLDDVAKKAAADKQQGGKNKVNSPKAAPAQRTPLALKPPSPKPLAAKDSLAARKPPTSTKQFEETSYRAEMQKTFAELRASHDAQEATARLAAAGVPPASRQPALLCDMLVIIVEEANGKMRKAALAAVAGLFLTGVWGAESLSEGVHSFLAEACEDLRLDVPALPQILSKELKPEFLEPLTQKKLLKVAGFDKYIK